MIKMASDDALDFGWRERAALAACNRIGKGKNQLRLIAR